MATVMFVGHGRAGKDTASEMFAKITGLRFAGSLSRQLAVHMAGVLGLSVEEAYARRHEDRMKWYEEGNKLREKGPTTLIRSALRHGDITNGARDRAEVIAAREEGLVDLIVWIENPRVPTDPTLKFGPDDCDIAILNTGGLDQLYRNLERLAAFANLIGEPDATQGPLQVSPETSGERKQEEAAV